MSKKMRSNILLLITAVIWGSAFVAQKAGASLEPFTYNGIRMFIGGLVLIPVIYVFKALSKDKEEAPKTEAELAAERKTLIVGGISCGVVLCIASTLQQFGLYFETSAGKAGFITSLYIVIVPVLGLFLRQKVKPIVWGCIVMGAFGFYLLTMAGKGEGFTIHTGELFVLICAVAFSCHILVVDHFSPKCDGIKLSCIQFLTAGIIGITCMFIFETPILADILDCWLPILYCGVISSGVAYTCQVLGQKDAEPAAASLILSLESVFSVLFGALILGERLTLLEGLGCIVIFIAVIIPQLPSKEERLQAK
ncbi:DMT family transporter [Anaerotruncus sp. 80]|uniref:DMT family transporter n=1 Tax=Anaerotruncus colihominis TaxID=169435 RepID=A0A845QKM7_9FIRM|nr:MULTISPECIES: DMT family transporter [Anaerotruncus]NBH61313.1 DMT family transporter [Anaerotruncus colihominis]NCF01968.1 DMT family transporter [Anaerotruncus sp. 80]